jgi:hypothetical protein|tara:strand:+ start:438 stop:734 length:297 start_codon:yes stop_codon:yes gene_type:complete
MLKKFNGEIPNNSLPSGSWFNTKEAADKLHIHFHTLQRLRKDGLLQPRLHYIQVTNTKTSPILWNIDQIMLRMGDFAAPVVGTYINEVEDASAEQVRS